MQIIKYPIKNAIVSEVAEFIWHLTGDMSESVDNKLLPVINTDLIINISSPIYYRCTGKAEVQAPPVHIRYIKKQSQMIRQSGNIDVWGISLYAYGVFPLMQVNMHKLEGQIIDLQQYNCSFATSVLNQLTQIESAQYGAQIIEDALCKCIENRIDIYEIYFLRSFMQNMCFTKIGEYCEQQQISIKQLERLIKKYIGITPKQLQRIRRFQTMSNHLIYSSAITTFAELVYQHEYFDQTHFIKEFKEYTDATPSVFLTANNSIKERMNQSQ